MLLWRPSQHAVAGVIVMRAGESFRITSAVWKLVLTREEFTTFALRLARRVVEVRKMEVCGAE